MKSQELHLNIDRYDAKSNQKKKNPNIKSHELKRKRCIEQWLFCLEEDISKLQRLNTLKFMQTMLEELTFNIQYENLYSIYSMRKVFGLVHFEMNKTS